jgi:SPP1 gp7 family putative phage head morphogenesis protein
MIQWSKHPENFVDNTLDVATPISPEEEELLMLKIWEGIVNDRNLDQDYYNRVASFLFLACQTGFGGNIDDFPYGSIQAATISGLRDNIYIFSAAKEFQQVKILSEFIFDEGVKSTFTQFKAKALPILQEFNQNYLKTEYNTAIGQSQMARDWVEFEAAKDLFPYLEYKTQQDARVREAHAMLSGVVKKVDDPFWNYYMPKNGWNCRCFVVSHPEGKVTKDLELPKWGTNDFPKVFKMNPGKDKLIFKKDHPYFLLNKSDKEFALDNFGLPLP